MSQVAAFHQRVAAALGGPEQARDRDAKKAGSMWLDARVVFSASRDGYRAHAIEINGPAASFDRSRDLRKQVDAAVAEWIDRARRVHGHRYDDAEITYIELRTPDGRFLDATNAGWEVLDASQVSNRPEPVSDAWAGTDSELSLTDVYEVVIDHRPMGDKISTDVRGQEKCIAFLEHVNRAFRVSVLQYRADHTQRDATREIWAQAWPERQLETEELARSVLSCYAGNERTADLYDTDEQFASALRDLAGPKFEYPDFSHLSVDEAITKARKLASIPELAANDQEPARTPTSRSPRM